jgi:hypothetical protein
MTNKFAGSSCGALVMAMLGLFLIQGCTKDAAPKLQTGYQAVVLTNGQVAFGKAEFLGADYVLLKDVFYIRSQVNPETKAVTNTLVKKGQEWHGAEEMYINSRHVVTIEPVSPDSQVAKLIREQKAQAPEAQKQ